MMPTTEIKLEDLKQLTEDLSTMEYQKCPTKKYWKKLATKKMLKFDEDKRNETN